MLLVFLTLAAQLTLGAAFYAAGSRIVAGGTPSRRSLVGWVASARAFRPLALFTGIALVASSGVAWLFADPGRVPWGFVVIGVPATASTWVLLRAGRLESRGRLRRARTQARLAGRVLAAGVAAQIVFLGFVLVRAGHPPGGLPFAALAALAAAGWIGLTGGLAGKPRPSSWFAAGLYLVGLLVALAALR